MSEEEIILIETWVRIRVAIRQNAIRNDPNTKQGQPAEEEKPKNGSEETQEKKDQ